MPADLTGSYMIPGDVSFPMQYTVEEVNLITQQGFGPSPAESQAIIDEANKQRAIDAERAADLT